MFVQVVSKPLVPPFRDGTKCFVRELANHIEDFELGVFGPDAALDEIPGAQVIDLGARRSTFAPGLVENVKTMAWLLLRSKAALWHFVFAPNPRSSRACHRITRLRRKKSIQTIASPPRSFATPNDLLFADIVVAQSADTKRRFLDSYQAAGLEPPRIEVIHPAIPPLIDPPVEARRAVFDALRLPPETHLLVYPGDLEMSQGAPRVAELARHLSSDLRTNAAHVVFAYRAKTPQARTRAAELAQSLRGIPVTFLPETPHIHALLAVATAVLFPVDDLYGKVDLPIVLLEALELRTQVLTSGEGPLAELVGARHRPFDPRVWLEEVALLLKKPPRPPEPDLAFRRTFSASRLGAAYEALYHDLLGPV